MVRLRHMDHKVRVMLVGGGSGGHFYPLMSIAEALIATGNAPKLYYIGPDRYDSAALEAHNISYVYCPAGKQRRYKSFLNFTDKFKILFGLIVALIKLYVIYPDVIMSKGGYTSVPVTLAARFLRIPVIVHESDVVLGRANALTARFARFITISYPETAEKIPEKRRDRVVFTGIPMRADLLAPARGQSAIPLAEEGSRPMILVLGGSQGAERVNNLILDSLDELLPTYTIVHQTGASNIDIVRASADSLILDASLRAHYHPVAFLGAPELNEVMHSASIIISRAGSTSIYEIAVHGKPSIIIPIPEEISHDQRKNAYAYARASGAVVLEESNLTDSLLLAEITRIMSDQAVYSSLCASAKAFAPTNAATEITRLITLIAEEH